MEDLSVQVEWFWIDTSWMPSAFEQSPKISWKSKGKDSIRKNFSCSFVQIRQIILQLFWFYEEHLGKTTCKQDLVKTGFFYDMLLKWNISLFKSSLRSWRRNSLLVSYYKVFNETKQSDIVGRFMCWLVMYRSIKNRRSHVSCIIKHIAIFILKVIFWNKFWLLFARQHADLDWQSGLD